MEAAKTLIRTTARTFFTNPKQILIIDALLLHSVLHVDDLMYLLSAQGKDVRSMLHPLRTAHLVWTSTRSEARVGSTRGTQREYYYIDFHATIDAIKYRIAKLRRRVKEEYKDDEGQRKDWECPRCKAQYDDMAILDKVNENGFYCERCKSTLVENEAAKRERGNHEKITLLNTQLSKFDALIAVVDGKEVPQNDFAEAWEKRREVVREVLPGQSGVPQYVEIEGRGKREEVKRQTFVEAGALNVTVQSQGEREAAEEEAKERRKRELAKQNVMPEWHSKFAVAGSADGVKRENADGDPFTPKREDDDKKDVLDPTQDTMDQYLLEMEREQREAERKAREAEGSEDEDDDFEDVVGTSVVGTPMSSQVGIAMKMEHTPRHPNGLKRELDMDADSISGTDTNANTPAADSFGDAKRIKLENGASHTGAVKNEPVNGAESDEDEDFEDVK